MDKTIDSEDYVSVAVIGSGYVGLVASACFAELGHRVICVDNSEARINALRDGDLPIHEEFLPELLRYGNRARLEFTTDLESAVRAAQLIFIAVGTPQSSRGDSDLSYVDTVASQIAPAINSYKLIVEKSTVPVSTSDWVRRVIQRNGGPPDLFDVASNPEFLREGTAVVDFLHPDRIVCGVDGERPAELLWRVYRPLTSGEYYGREGAIPGPRRKECPPPFLLTSTKAAEIIKHASNAFLATKISFINAVSNIWRQPA